MKAKIMRTVYGMVTVMSLFLACSEAETGMIQILWSGSWMFVCLLSAKRFEKCLDKEEREERV